MEIDEQMNSALRRQERLFRIQDVMAYITLVTINATFLVILLKGV